MLPCAPYRRRLPDEREAIEVTTAKNVAEAAKLNTA